MRGGEVVEVLACCVLRVACCVLRVACCVLRARGVSSAVSSE